MQQPMMPNALLPVSASTQLLFIIGYQCSSGCAHMRLIRAATTVLAKVKIILTHIFFFSACNCMLLAAVFIPAAYCLFGVEL